jgi:uncharacterized membrane protein
MKVLREVLAALGLLFTVGVVAAHYGSLPQTIPTHFDARGLPNGWGDKSMLWLVPGLACFFYAVMTLVSFVPPSKINPPVSAERRVAVAPIAKRMIGWLKAELVWIMAVLCAVMVRDALGRSNGLTIWFVPVEMCVVFGTIGFYLWRMMRVAA